MWRRLVAEQLASGLSQDRFCREQQLPAGRFHYWKYTKLPELEGSEEKEGATEATTCPAILLPVKVVESRPAGAWGAIPEEAGSSGVQIHLPSGLRISLQRGFDASVLREVVEVLGC